MMKQNPLILGLLLFYLSLGGTTISALERYDYSQIKGDFSKHAPPGKDVPPNTVLTLGKAVSTAICNNPETKIALAKIRQGRALLKKAEAAFWPKFDFYTEYTRGDSPSGSLFKTIDQRLFVSGTDFNNPGIFENVETGITGNLALFNGGRNILSKFMADEDLNISSYDEKSTRNRITAEVISIWYDLLSAEEYILISKESMETIRTQLDMMTVKYRGGSALKSDILSLKVRLAEAEEELVKNRNRLQITQYTLKNILGVNPDKDIKIDKATIPPVKIPETYEEGIETAFLYRPELKKIRAVVKKARMGMDLAASTYLPSLNLMGKYYHDDPEMDYDRKRENWTLGIVMNWNLFSGFSGKADKTVSRAMLEEALAADRKTALDIGLDVRNAYLMLDEAAARLKVAGKSVAMAEETLHLVRIQYKGGSATITRYLEAELAKNSARTRATAARFDHEKAAAHIARATGLLIKPGGFF